MNRQKTRYSAAFIALIALVFFGSGEKTSFAQGNIRIVHTQQKEARSDTYLGRDLWFAIPLNYSPTDRSTKYFNVYVNSPRNTTVNLQIGNGPIVQKPVSAGKVTVFTSPTPTKPSSNIPLSTEMYSSGVVEQKVIHVWSNDADIAVYLLSRVAYSSGGMYVLPPTGWGKEYIVGAYESIFDPTGQADWPSEFAIVSNQDNTTVTITPTWDIRKDGFPTVIEHPKQIPFTVNLNKGECVQYQTVLPINDGECDLTGTIIASNNTIGVEGCSVDPYIPFPYGYGDYCLSMLQPVRTWSNTYFTSPFAGRTYGGDVYCVIGTKGQTIYRNGTQIALLNFYGDHYFIYDETSASPAAIWTSDAPFELMQYIPSATFGTGNPLSTTRNNGDADMCNINPADQFGTRIYFQVPTIDLASGQTNFTNYVNILLPAGHESTTTYDGILLSGPAPPNVIKKERFVVPTTSWEAMRLTYRPGQGEGTHFIASDTGVGVYLYGYGQDDSYSWAGSLGIRNHADPDTIPPLAFAAGPCFCAHVRLYDTGPGQSKLSDFTKDSSSNMTFYPDPAFVAGAGTDSSFYDMCVIDSSLEAYLSVSVYDLAGNRTTVTSIYKPQFVKFSPDPLNFGTVNVGNTAFKYDTICNNNQTPFHFVGANLNFTNGTKTDALGFTIDSTGADGDIPFGGCRVIKIKGLSMVPPTVRDTLTLTDECITMIDPISMNGGAADFDIANYSFDCTPLNAGRPSLNYFITNPSGIDITIDSVWLDDNVNFGYNITTPATNDYLNGKMVVPNSNTASGNYQIVVTFNPQTLGSICTIIHVRSKVGGIVKTAKVCGLGCMPDVVSIVDTNGSNCSDPSSFRVPLDNIGNYFDSLVTVTGVSTSKGFSKVVLEDPLGNTINLPYHLDSSATIFASVLFTPAAKACGLFTDTIIATRLGGQIAAKTTVNVVVHYQEADVTRDNVDFGPQPFGGTKVQNYFEVCNTNGCDPLVITSVPQLSAAGTTSFTLSNIYKVGAVTKTLPVTLAPGECLDVYVDFDPAKSNVASQTDSFGVVSNACNGAQTGHVLAEITTAPPSILGFSHPPLFSCDAASDSSVTYTNSNAVAGTITTINITGPNNTNFVSTLTPPIAVPAHSSVKIPINFTPNPVSGQQLYTAIITVTYDNGAGSVTNASANVSATGQGIDLAVASQFANLVATAGTTVYLPIQLSLNKHGLILPLSTVNITRIELTYAYDQNILDIVGNNIAGAVKFSNPAWSVDLATSKIDMAAGTLQLNVIGPALTDADLSRTFDSITFKASLPKGGTSTPVKLITANFLSGGSPVGNCITIARKDSTFGLDYACGDSSLQKFMNSGTVFQAFPVTPNPAGNGGGSVLNFTYASRTEGVISLVLYDELGKEVARVIDEQNLPAGSYGVRYDISRLPEGTYIYRYTLNKSNAISGRIVIQK